MILLQPTLVAKIIKKIMPEKVVTGDFKKEMTKALSLFILYLQNSIDRKKYGREDVINALEREGLGKVA
jgi:histone H3/H4